ncbi:hypothetical protein C8F01DRAFT_1158975 [Mycena amicta]|nr:hypothetical protein C8F01DRAFT_1158975 [Mycena amicta]
MFASGVTRASIAADQGHRACRYVSSSGLGLRDPKSEWELPPHCRLRLRLQFRFQSFRLLFPRRQRRPLRYPAARSGHGDACLWPGHYESDFFGIRRQPRSVSALSSTFEPRGSDNPVNIAATKCTGTSTGVRFPGPDYARGQCPCHDPPLPSPAPIRKQIASKREHLGSHTGGAQTPPAVEATSKPLSIVVAGVALDRSGRVFASIRS